MLFQYTLSQSGPCLTDSQICSKRTSLVYQLDKVLREIKTAIALAFTTFLLVVSFSALQQGLDKRSFKNKTLTDVLKNGIFREKSALGGNMVATGVFSYGDLSANFNGMRFWNHMLQKRDDVLGVAYNVGPYVRCEAGKWKTTEFKIDFRNYVDASMESRGFYQCPRDVKLLEQMQTKYNVLMAHDPTGLTISHWIINMKGLGQVNYFGEFNE